MSEVLVYYLVWGALALALVAIEAWARRARSLTLTLTDVLHVVRSTRAGRIVLTLAWMWLGWHVFAR